MRLKTLLVCLSAFILGVIVIATGCNRDPVLPAGIFVGSPTPTFTATVIPNPTAAPSATPVTWPGQTTSTSSMFQNVNVGSYVVETNYWNSTQCPVSQTVNINNVTGAFSVILGPNCSSSSNVASYPNIFYGNEEGSVSPGSVLPIQVSALNSVTSNWNFTPGGTASDAWDIAYDIWLGPTMNCTSGFPCGGAELMIWVDYLNLTGYQNAHGTISVGGTSWDLWQAPGGGGGNTWTYLSYLSEKPSAQPVNNLNILTFIQDAVSKGFINPSWYLYSIPAGIELRKGGIPFTSNSFSVSIQ